jgi:hypothetical protein
MDKKDIEPGREYGYRPAPRRHTPFERVRVVERVRSQCGRSNGLTPTPGFANT